MRVSTLLAAALLISAPAFAQQSGDVANGKNHFDNDGCWQCHGYGGQGAALTGPRIARTALTFDQFLNQLRHPANAMPPFEAPIVPDATARDIYAYLESMPKPPEAKDIPMLYATKGK